MWDGLSLISATILSGLFVILLSFGLLCVQSFTLTKGLIIYIFKVMWLQYASLLFKSPSLTLWILWFEDLLLREFIFRLNLVAVIAHENLNERSTSLVAHIKLHQFHPQLYRVFFFCVCENLAHVFLSLLTSISFSCKQVRVVCGSINWVTFSALFFCYTH